MNVHYTTSNTINLKFVFVSHRKECMAKIGQKFQEIRTHTRHSCLCAIRNAQLFINQPLINYLRIPSIYRLVRKKSGCWLLFLAAAAFYLLWCVFDCEWFAKEWRFFLKQKQMTCCITHYPMYTIQKTHQTPIQANRWLLDVFFKKLLYFS